MANLPLRWSPGQGYPRSRSPEVPVTFLGQDHILRSKVIPRLNVNIWGFSVLRPFEAALTLGDPWSRLHEVKVAF